MSVSTVPAPAAATATPSAATSMPAARPATGARPALVLRRPPPIRLASADSGGSLGIVEFDGELTLITPGAASTLRAGEAALAPRGIPHAYRVESERARFLVVYTPGGFADFGAAASVPAGFADLPPADRVLYLPALLDRRDRWHQAAAEWYSRCADELVTTPLVLAETDYLAERRLGSTYAAAIRNDLAAGAYEVKWWPQAVGEMVTVADRYTDSALGLTDASLVALAAHVETTRIATFDERHFRNLRPLRGGDAFTLLPLDA